MNLLALRSRGPHEWPSVNYRQRYWSINSLHRVLHSDAAPTLRDVCVWFVRRWALRADVYFDRYLALHANDCTVSTADGDAIMTTLCNWLFQNSMRFYLSHPASMGWFVGRQAASSSDHYQHFLNSILRQLTTTAATCIRDVFHCRPVHSYHSNWYYHRDEWSLSTNQLTTVDIGTDTDCDTICIQTGADAEGHAVSTVLAAQALPHFDRSLVQTMGVYHPYMLAWGGDHQEGLR